MKLAQLRALGAFGIEPQLLELLKGRLLNVDGLNSMDWIVDILSGPYQFEGFIIRGLKHRCTGCNKTSRIVMSLLDSIERHCRSPKRLPRARVTTNGNSFFGIEVV